MKIGYLCNIHVNIRKYIIPLCSQKICVMEMLKIHNDGPVGISAM